MLMENGIREDEALNGGERGAVRRGSNEGK